MSKSKKIIIGLGIFVGIIAVIVISLLLTTGKERDLATQFVTDISSGNTSSAYNQYSAALKEVQDITTFESQVKTLKLDTSCKLAISGISSTASTDYGTTKTIEGSVKCKDKTIESAEFVYNDEGKLLSFSIK